MKKIVKRAVRLSFPFLYYLIQYKRTASTMLNVMNKNESDSCNAIFERFMQDCEGKHCLQIGVKDSIGKKYGSNWVSVDKFDTREFIDFQYDIHDLPFETDSFDAVVCISILEHVPYPVKAISELNRVLKPGGKIWIQVPWLYPYHAVPKDYWRISPDGLRIWMENFKEINCGIELWDKTSLIISSYYLGEKK